MQNKQLCQFASFALKTECLSMYRIIGFWEEELQKKNVNKLKRVAKYQRLKKWIS